MMREGIQMATTSNPVPTPAPTFGETLLTDIEKVGLALVTSAPSMLPVFVHSQRGLIIANASENLFANILQALFNKA